MKIPVTPPVLEREMDDWGDESADKLFQIATAGVGLVDDRGRYLHWDKIRHFVPPQGFTPEMYWLAIRNARRGSSRVLPFFKDKIGAPFSFCIPDNVLRDLLWISENATGSIEADTKISDPRIKRTYLISSLMEEAISSSQLEGASTTRRVAKELIRTGRSPRNHSEKMIVNNWRAMAFIRELKGEALTPSIIFELHRILTEGTLSDEDAEKAGEFRGKEDDICVYARDGSIPVHIPPPAGELPERLQSLCDFANKLDEKDNAYIPPIIRAIAIHFMIGYDHPFVDGNGRTARALFYWMMARESYWLMEYISISRAIKKAPSKYMMAYLHTETDGNDLTYFIVHQLAIVKEAIADLHEYLAEKSRQQKDVQRILDSSPLNSLLNFRQISLLRNALKNPGAEYTIKSHRTSHGVSYQTARTDLLELSDSYKLLRKFKSGRMDAFIVPANIKDLIGSSRHQ